MRFKILLFISFAVAAIGCKKLDKLTQFNIDYNDTIVIPSAIGINLPFNILTPAIETNSESIFGINETRKDLIEEITLTALDLSIISPADADFSFLRSIRIYISADGLEETEIAWKDSIPNDVGKVLNLETGDTDLKEYIKKDEFNIRLNTVTDKLLMSDHQIKMHSEFFVDAKILGL